MDVEQRLNRQDALLAAARAFLLPGRFFLGRDRSDLLLLLVVQLNRRSCIRCSAGWATPGRLLQCALLAVICGLNPESLFAADAHATFLAALRAQGWDDTAVEYLDWVEKSPLMTRAFAEELPYQRALSLAERAKQIKNRSERERLQAEAADAFQRYAQSRPDSPAALDALRESANIYASQALTTLTAAERLPEQATAQREEASVQARKLFQQASQATEQVVELCTNGLAALPKAAVAQADPEAKGRRDLLRERQVEARFLHARIAFESAATYGKNASEFDETLDRATREFGALVQEHRGSVVGDTSRFYQGRCAQELGAYEKALGCYKDALGTPSANEEFRRLKARVHRRIAECLIATDKLDDAVEQCEKWLAGSQPAERNEPEWLEVAYTLASAYQAQAKAADAGSSDEKQLQSKARTLFRDVSQRANEFQHQARLQLASINQSNSNAGDLRTFADAFTAGKEAIELWNSSTLAAKLAKDNNPEAVDELKGQADQRKRGALEVFERAVQLADRQTPLDELNTARYFLALLYWEEERIYEAAVLAEFLATRYPEDENAPNAAKLAMAAYEKSAIEAKSEAGRTPGVPPSETYESLKLAELAELVAARWPDTQDALSAVNVLIQTALRENRLADAEALLDRLPEESRSAAELSLGAGLWTRYLRATVGRGAAPSDDAVAQRDKAGQFLRSGFEGLRAGGNPSSIAAAGALYYVQYLLAAENPAAAIDVLEDEGVGPLSLVEAASTAASNPEFVLETYKAALRSYLSVQPPQPKRAQEMMVALEEFAGQDGGAVAAKKLTDIYLSLAVQLQRQLEELSAAGQQEQTRYVAEAFGRVLDRVAQRPDAESWQIRNWLAQMNLLIGKSLADEDALVYATRAREAYEAMLAAAAQDKKYAPDANSVLAVRMRLGECLAAQGDYQQAIEQYAEILRERPNTLDLQLAAATALQEWGVAKREPSAIERSIHGDLPQANGKNLIWGWLRLANMAQQARRQAASGTVDAAARQRAERFRDLFFEARYNIARAHYLAAGVAPADKRQEELRAAKTNVDQMMQLYPDLGGEKWSAAFKQLLEQVNQELQK